MPIKKKTPSVKKKAISKTKQKYKELTHTFISENENIEIFYRKWIPSKVTRIIVIQHGFGEHSGRYADFINDLNLPNTAFYALDARGHGQSHGKRGHTLEFQHYIDDLSSLIEIAKKEQKKKEILLFGHSLGGLIALQYAVQGNNQTNLSGMVLSSAALYIEMNLEKRIKKVFAKILSSIIPSATTAANLDINTLSHDKEQVEKYRLDPLVHGRISFKMGDNLFNLGKVMIKKAHTITCPTLIIHGRGDKIVYWKGSEDLHKQIASEDKALLLYEKLYHEMLNELPEDREKVIRDIATWIKARK